MKKSFAAAALAAALMLALTACGTAQQTAQRERFDRFQPQCSGAEGAAHGQHQKIQCQKHQYGKSGIVALLGGSFKQKGRHGTEQPQHQRADLGVIAEVVLFQLDCFCVRHGETSSISDFER